LETCGLHRKRVLTDGQQRNRVISSFICSDHTLQTRADICCLHHSAGDHRSGLILDCSKQPSSGFLRDSGMSSKKQSNKHAQYTTSTHGSGVRKGGWVVEV